MGHSQSSGKKSLTAKKWVKVCNDCCGYSREEEAQGELIVQPQRHTTRMYDPWVTTQRASHAPPPGQVNQSSRINHSFVAPTGVHPPMHSTRMRVPAQPPLYTNPTHTHRGAPIPEAVEYIPPTNNPTVNQSSRINHSFVAPTCVHPPMHSTRMHVPTQPPLHTNPTHTHRGAPIPEAVEYIPPTNDPTTIVTLKHSEQKRYTNILPTAPQKLPSAASHLTETDKRDPRRPENSQTKSTAENKIKKPANTNTNTNTNSRSHTDEKKNYPPRDLKNKIDRQSAEVQRTRQNKSSAPSELRGGSALHAHVLSPPTSPLANAVSVREPRGSSHSQHSPFSLEAPPTPTEPVPPSQNPPHFPSERFGRRLEDDLINLHTLIFESPDNELKLSGDKNCPYKIDHNRGLMLLIDPDNPDATLTGSLEADHALACYKKALSTLAAFEYVARRRYQVFDMPYEEFKDSQNNLLPLPKVEDEDHLQMLAEKYDDTPAGEETYFSRIKNFLHQLALRERGDYVDDYPEIRRFNTRMRRLRCRLARMFPMGEPWEEMALDEKKTPQAWGQWKEFLHINCLRNVRVLEERCAEIAQREQSANKPKEDSTYMKRFTFLATMTNAIDRLREQLPYDIEGGEEAVIEL